MKGRIGKNKTERNLWMKKVKAKAIKMRGSDGGRER